MHVSFGMRVISLLAVYSQLLPGCTPTSDVITVHYSQLYNGAFNKKFLVLMFYSHGCGACREGMPKFLETSKSIGLPRDVQFGVVDIFEDPVLGMHYNAKMLPVIFFLPYGFQAPITYRGRIIEADLEASILREYSIVQSQGPSKALEPNSTKEDNNSTQQCKEIDPKDFEKYILNPKIHVMVMFYAQPCSDLCDIFETLAKVYKNDGNINFYKVDISKAPLIVKHFKLSENPSAVWFPVTDKKFGTVFREKFNPTLLIKFVNKNSGNARTLDGGLEAKAGRIPELDDIIEKHISDILSKRDLKYVNSRLESVAQKLPHAKRFKEYYLTIVKEIEKGRDASMILEKEQDFISEKRKIKTLSQRAKDDWKKYFNIIGSFIEIAETFLLKLHPTMKEGESQKEDLSLKQLKTLNDNFIKSRKNFKNDEL